MLIIMHEHYRVWKNVNTTEGILKNNQYTKVLIALEYLLAPRYRAGIKTVFGKLPIDASYNKANIGRVIGCDGYFTKLTTHNTGIDFIWFDDLKNEFLFWGRYKCDVVKAINIINWRVVKYQSFSPANKIAEASASVVANALTEVSDTVAIIVGDTINPVWSASDKSNIPEEVHDTVPLTLNESPLMEDISSRCGVINENDTNMLGGIITKIIELIGSGNTDAFE